MEPLRLLGRRPTVNMEQFQRLGWRLEVGGENRTPPEARQEAGNKPGDNNRKLGAGVQDQRPGAKDQSTRPEKGQPD